ncbi:MAG: hypothetical protein JNK56_01945 [Myxococcales bacterium]|nr:hypothetical protein [Myxococcales bacterium]
MRAVLYTLLGWLLLASVAGLGHSFGLTVMLPSTSAVLLVHLAFTRDHAPHTAGPELALPLGLAVAITLGYLEDLHQGTPIGALSLAHGVAYLLAVWAGTRIAVEGAIVRALAAGVVTALVDLLTFAELMLLADRLGIASGALVRALPMLRWHALATVLAAPAVWLLADLVLGLWDRLLGRNRPSTGGARRPLATATWYRS